MAHIHCLDCDTGKENRCDKCKYFVVANAILANKANVKGEDLKSFIQMLYSLSGEKDHKEKEGISYE